MKMIIIISIAIAVAGLLLIAFIPTPKPTGGCDIACVRRNFS